MTPLYHMLSAWTFVMLLVIAASVDFGGRTQWVRNRTGHEGVECRHSPCFVCMVNGWGIGLATLYAIYTIIAFLDAHT